jgi:agmatine deiminase
MVAESKNSVRFPAEWEPHAATWLAWPHYENDWPGKFEAIPWVYAEIIRHLSKHERVELIVNDAQSERRARKTLDKANALNNNVRFHRWPTNRVWTRDSGCTFVMGADRLAAVTWRFNAWAKYPNWKHDVKIGGLIAEAAEAEPIQPRFRDLHVVLEGGSIDSNGRGTLLTTEECLLSKIQQRNPGLQRGDYEKIFSEYLGVTNVIWLGSGIAGDDTHGHVDDITRFGSSNSIVTMVESNPKDPNYKPLRENLSRLQRATDCEDKKFEIIEMPMPRPVFFEDRRLPASYANFYIANGIVLAPVFNDGNDRIALDILAKVFPDREIVGIYSGDLIWGFGALHCMTQPQPA